MEHRYIIRSGNFELFGQKLKHIACDLDAIKKAAIERAQSENCEEIAEFGTEEAALNALKSYKSDIRDAHFCVGMGYCGTVYWCDHEFGDDFISVDTLEYAKFEDGCLRNFSADDEEDE